MFVVDKNEESRMLHNRIENLNVVIEKMQGEIKNVIYRIQHCTFIDSWGAFCFS